MTGPFNRIIEGVAEIARKLGATVTDSGNRLADNIEGIASVVGGGGASALIVRSVVVEGKLEEYRLDHTWQEIHDAAPLVWYEEPAMGGANIYFPFVGDGAAEGDYIIFFDGVMGEGSRIFVTDSADGYPSSEK